MMNDDSVRIAAEEVFKKLSFFDALSFVIITELLDGMPYLTFGRYFRAPASRLPRAVPCKEKTEDGQEDVVAPGAQRKSRSVPGAREPTVSGLAS
jgi:hypothetical protein